MKKGTFSVVGVGRMGRRHIHVAKKLNLELIGVADVSRASLQETKDEFDLDDKLLFSSTETLFKNNVPEVLIVATTADSHCAITCEAAKEGVKYILVEKPLAVSLSECTKMIETCRNTGTFLSVNHQMRFMDQYIKPKQMINSDAFGGFTSMTVVAGNFGMSMNGTHYFEAFRFISDEDPYEVTAWFDNDVISNPRGRQFEDRAGSIRVTTKGGKRLYMEIGSDQGHGLEVLYAGRNGHISVSELYGELVSTVREIEFREFPTTRYGMPAVRKQEVIKPAEVIDSSAMVLNALINDENKVTAEQGMMAVKVLVAAFISAEKGNKSIKLDDLIGDTRVFPWA